MPRARRAELPFAAGVNKDDAPAVAEAYMTDCNWLRYVRGRWEVMGGYELLTSQTFSGIARGAVSFADQNGTRILGFGTAADLYALHSGSLATITPEKVRGTLTDPFDTVSGSDVVTVTHVEHGLHDADTITFSLADAVGGITLDGDYVVSIINFDKYTVTHTSSATSTATGGGKVEYVAGLDVGSVDGIGGFGFGTGAYGSGLYGTTTSGDINPRSWDLHAWGDFLLALPENGALYEWIPQGSYPELITNGDFAASDEWTTGTGWSIGSGVATATAGSASDLEQDMTGTLKPGYTYVIEFDATVTAGSFVTRITSQPTGGSATDYQFGEAIAKSGSYKRYITTPANPVKFKIAKDATFAGTIDNVSIKVASTAYRLRDAPQYSKCMAVDGSNRVILGGTVDLVGVFNPLMVRWSDTENNRTWDPDTDNGAGFYVLGHGALIRSILPGKTENTVFTDTAIYAMRPTSSGYDFKSSTTAVGLKSKHAAVESNGMAFFWGSDDNFYILNGGVPLVLNCPLARDVKDNLSTNQQGKIEAFAVPEFFEIWWLYPDQRDGDGLECSRAIVYNWASQCWYPCAIERTSAVQKGVTRETVMFSTDGQIFYHDRGHTANGGALEWYGETAPLDFGQGDNLFCLSAFIPEFEEQSGAISIEIYGRDGMQGAYSLMDTLSANADYADPLWTRCMARQMKFKFSGNSTPAFNRFGKVIVDVAQSGARR